MFILDSVPWIFGVYIDLIKPSKKHEVLDFLRKHPLIIDSANFFRRKRE
jgi:hypothetical protein